jgi:N-acetyl-anhydromuramyl-L-alanine amidase AmpD
MMPSLTIEVAKPVGKAWGGLSKGAVRQGMLLHYDASRSDVGAVAWLEDDARARVSYHYLVLDDGRVLQIAPLGSRAWHAGDCKSSDRRLVYTDANSAFYGIAVAATDGERATEAQKASVALLCRYLFWLEGWADADTWRITGHDAHAWPRGRKTDPTGTDPVHPVLSVEEIRTRFATTEWRGIP